MTTNLRISRQQLAAFLKNDHDAIRQFETLFATVGTPAPDSTDRVERLEEAVGALELAPRSTMLPETTVKGRRIITASTDSIGFYETDTLEVEFTESADIISIETSRPAWVRVYSSAAARTADAWRLYSKDPTPGTGLMVEVLTFLPDDLLIYLSPVPFWNNCDTVLGKTAYIAVTRWDNNPSEAIDLTFTILPQEEMDKNGSQGLPGPRGFTGAGYRSLGEWSSTETYLEGDVVGRNGSVYCSLLNDNLNQPPETIGSTHWTLWVSKGDTGESSVTLKTDGEDNALQTTLNLIAGANVTLTADEGGGVTIATTGGSGEGSITTAPIGTPASLPADGYVDLYANYSPGNQVPTMTSNTTPSGTCSASESYGSTPPWYAFSASGDSYNGWLTNGSALPQWIQYLFPSAKIITSYTIIPWSADNFPGRSPTAWKLQGSNDGSTWTDLDTQSISSSSWVSNTAATFYMSSNTTAYLYYRLYITANGGDSYTAIKRLGLFAEGTSGNLDLYMRDPAGNVRKMTAISV